MAPKFEAPKPKIEAQQGSAEQAKERLDRLKPTFDAQKKERDDLKEKEGIRNFTPEQKARFEKAFGRPLNGETLQKLIVDDVTDIEKKDPGITKMLLCEDEGGVKKFNALGNHDLEWNVGLKNLVNEKVGSVVLKIHPRNLDKGGNKQLLTRYPEAKKAYDEYKANGTVAYFERKSTIKTQGNFYDNDGYLRILQGDTWEEGKIMDETEYTQYKAKDEENQKKGLPVWKEGENGQPGSLEYKPLDLNGKTEVADQISESILSPAQKEMAKIIEQRFLAAGLPKSVAAAAIVNAYAESGLRPGATGDSGHSIGLFQLHDRGGGHGMSVEERKDPGINTDTILNREVLKGFGKNLRAAAAGGASIAELSAIFSRDIERPRDREGAMAKRQRIARRFFGGGADARAEGSNVA